MNPDVIIVGSGLFGSMTAKYLRKKGMDVLIIDNREPMAASKCSFGIWKDGWVNPSIKDKVILGQPTLNEFVGGIKEIEYDNLDKKTVEKLYAVDCSLILNEKVLSGKVISIKNRHVVFKKMGNFEESIIAKKAVIVCAGVWTPFLLKDYKNVPAIDNQWGLVIEGTGELKRSKIMTWAPYKQSVFLKQKNDRFLFGDGATVKNPKENDKRLSVVGDRVLVHMSDISKFTTDNIVQLKEGFRPYLRNTEGSIVNQHDKNLFSATGGAKNSTILSGYVAQTLYNFVKGI